MGLLESSEMEREVYMYLLLKFLMQSLRCKILSSEEADYMLATGPIIV